MTMIMTEQGSLPRLTAFEIIIHALADGFSVYFLLGLPWRGEWEQADSIEAAALLLVIVLSAVIVVGRFRPEIRGL